MRVSYVIRYNKYTFRLLYKPFDFYSMHSACVSLVFENLSYRYINKCASFSSNDNTVWLAKLLSFMLISVTLLS